MQPGLWVIMNGGLAAIATACGVTPQAAIAAAKPPFAITHAPGAMLVTDRRNREFAVL